MGTLAARDGWRNAIADLPVTPGHIPAFFLAHGSPLLGWPEDTPIPSGLSRGVWDWMGRDGPLGQFLDDFGPALVEKYNPKGIVVFSAHWETDNERLVTDYGNENPLLMDYYGFHTDIYNIEFHSRGDVALTNRILDAFKKANLPARSTKLTEARGKDGRDHGVFVPFKRMFGASPSFPIVEVSLDASLSPSKNWAIGKALTELRAEGYLIIAGGLAIHSFANNLEAFNINTAKPIIQEFQNAITDAVVLQDPGARRTALESLTNHPGFRVAHPREEHFIPLYIAAGAGEMGGSRVVGNIYAQTTYAFGL
ncbi:hypothetical protein BS47DRAFT_1378251 [Hydnum rufescens UP504]|uniref:Extradiol ring-cleavage dioxygenase class III enzyme subunit B domain-containing protein n=1 Tax=Hydnum rufescens UP504 TaxID=1448309 RepID=A0A9P6DNZ8_9AGAM|nr:hypothetical protein BS47DRAFT_1378251 [Hydnum rufescens UP504]